MVRNPLAVIEEPLLYNKFHDSKRKPQISASWQSKTLMMNQPSFCVASVISELIHIMYLNMNHLHSFAQLWWGFFLFLSISIINYDDDAKSSCSLRQCLTSNMPNRCLTMTKSIISHWHTFFSQIQMWLDYTLTHCCLWDLVCLKKYFFPRNTLILDSSLLP